MKSIECRSVEPLIILGLIINRNIRQELPPIPIRIANITLEPKRPILRNNIAPSRRKHHFPSPISFNIVQKLWTGHHAEVPDHHFTARGGVIAKLELGEVGCITSSLFYEDAGWIVEEY